MEQSSRQPPLPPSIGRRARVVRVAVARSDGRPVVVVNHPIARRGAGPHLQSSANRGHERSVPFPTLYWLACPELVRDISRLEHSGVIAELQSQLDADADLRRRLADDHRRYIDQRRQLIDVARYPDIADHLEHRGIAGMRNFAAVKCLHAHYAQHLADFNVIGDRLEQHSLIKRPNVIIHTP